jgi:hypothetical protein
MPDMLFDQRQIHLRKHLSSPSNQHFGSTNLTESCKERSKRHQRNDFENVVCPRIYRCISQYTGIFHSREETNTEIIAHFAGLRAALDHGHPFPFHPLCCVYHPAQPESYRQKRKGKRNKEQEKGYNARKRGSESRRSDCLPGIGKAKSKENASRTPVAMQKKRKGVVVRA